MVKISVDGEELSLECYQCGYDIGEEDLDLGLGTSFIMHFDPGQSNYPFAPDEPAAFYVECMKCHNEFDKKMGMK